MFEKYRKKPVNALYFDSADDGKVEWLIENRIIDLHDVCCSDDKIRKKYMIETPEGRMVVTDGDWIVCGVNGEYYPVKDDIFKKTYEKVNNSGCC